MRLMADEMFFRDFCTQENWQTAVLFHSRILFFTWLMAACAMFFRDFCTQENWQAAVLFQFKNIIFHVANG
jgi:hypothetical protein